MDTTTPGTTGRKPECETLSVPEAGARYFGLSRNGSYEAAARGQLPTIRIGRLLRVPVRAMERLLDQAGQAA
jgi:ribosomal protein S14